MAGTNAQGLAAIGSQYGPWTKVIVINAMVIFPAVFGI